VGAGGDVFADELGAEFETVHGVVELADCASRKAT
jgi:hypothetical protein